MTRRRSAPVWAALIGSGIAGALVALQSRANGGLSKELGDPYVTAAVSFSSSLVLLLAVLVFAPKSRAGIRAIVVEVRTRKLPWWMLTGGAFGAFFVFGASLAGPVIGLAIFTVGIVAGQVFSGILIDRFGIGPSGRLDPTALRILGTILAVIAVVVSVISDLQDPHADLADLWLVVVPFLAGVGASWQSAANGRLKATARSAISSTFFNYILGATLLLIVAGVSIGVNGWPTAWPSDPLLYIGGLLGPLFIAFSALLVRTAGVLLLSMSNVAGQLIAAVAFEAWLPLAEGVTGWMLAGAALALLAVVIAAIPKRRKAGDAPEFLAMAGSGDPH